MNYIMKIKLRIAIIADWLIDFWWAELVISHLLELFPDADIYTSVCFMNHPMLEGRRVHASWIQKIPFLNRKHKLAGILRPWAFRGFDLSGYDLVICSSSAESKQVAMGKWNTSPQPSPKGEGASWNLPSLKERGPRGEVLCYCHTPTRYYWSHAKEYEDMMEFGFLNPLVKVVFRLVKNWMRKVDFAAAQKVDFFIANSQTTAERIQTYYNRESEVIYPGVPHPSPLLKERGSQVPLPLSEGEGTEGWGGYYFGISRCIPYKRLDLLVDAFNTNGKPLILATNTDNLLYHELKAKSKPNITWIFSPPVKEKLQLYANAKAFLFPPEEDFGLVPVEAMMSGTPVIAYGKWGATESVVDGETGLFFTPQTPEALNEAIEIFEKMEWDTEKIRARGMEFSKEKFQGRMHSYILQNCRQYCRV
jgi:glycosyltransferase involved in cell wall biosynthesis